METGSGPVAHCTRARRFCIAQASSTALYAHSNSSAAEANAALHLKADVCDALRHLCLVPTVNLAFKSHRSHAPNRSLLRNNRLGRPI
jgi:hypothetical protein